MHPGSPEPLSQWNAIGSVSGGCVEAAVCELCRQTLEDGTAVTERLGYSDEDTFAVGLTCGGGGHLRHPDAGRRSRPHRCRLRAQNRRARRVAVARISSGSAELTGRALLVRPDSGYEAGFAAHPDPDHAVAGEALAHLEAGRTSTLEIGETEFSCGSAVTVLIESSVPSPRMIVFGASTSPPLSCESASSSATT